VFHYAGPLGAPAGAEPRVSSRHLMLEIDLATVFSVDDSQFMRSLAGEVGARFSRPPRNDVRRRHIRARQ
jgi:hypothetical protein